MPIAAAAKIKRVRITSAKTLGNRNHAPKVPKTTPVKILSIQQPSATFLSPSERLGIDRDEILSELLGSCDLWTGRRVLTPFLDNRTKHPGDSGCWLYHAGGMDEKAIRRGALIKLRRAILERFPPGRERTAGCGGWRAARRQQAQAAPRGGLRLTLLGQLAAWSI
jgi:hypothetical protein